MSEFVYGRHPVVNAFKTTPERIEKIWILNSETVISKFMHLVKQARKQKIIVNAVDRKALDRLVDGRNHQGIVARISSIDLTPFDEWWAQNAETANLLLLLDQIQDPRNLGAIFRTSAAADVDGILLPKHGTAPLSGAADKASAGTIHFVNPVRIGNVAQTLQKMKTSGFWVLAVSEKAEHSIHEIDMTGKLVLLFGGEGRGIRRLSREEADIEAKIPLTGPAGSINVASAVAIALYERLRQKTVGRGVEKKNLDF